MDIFQIGDILHSQLAVITQHFTPSADQVARARRITEAFEAGVGGLVVVDNKLIEKPVLRSMYRILAIAERMATKSAVAAEEA